MPVNNRHIDQPKQSLPQSHRDIEVGQDENIDCQICPSADQTVQISSAEAEIYLEYLRKKISHQAKDPFSLPFLNLKFDQLESSWKGVTEQLNLESRIYGMRVDNYHDNTIKMLNHFIRNQEEQIRKEFNPNQNQLKNQQQSHRNQQQKSNPNFYLQKPEKQILNTAIFRRLENMSLWKVIFKKSESLSQIQLNTLELSDDLALQLDFKTVNYRPKKFASNDQKNSIQIEDNAFSRYPYITQVLDIYREIQILRKEVMEQMNEIQAIRKDKKKILNNQHIQNPLWQMNLGIRDIDFSDFYQEFNDFQRYRDQEVKTQLDEDPIFQPVFLDEPRENIFTPKLFGLHTIKVDPIIESDSENSEGQSEKSVEADLYQPQRDFLFNSTYKKTKKGENRNLRRIKRTNNTNVDFSNASLIVDRKWALKNKKINRANRKNNNLIPINYVVIYENRNPFKKVKKVPKNRATADIQGTMNNFDFAQTEYISKPLGITNDPLIFESDAQERRYEDKDSQQSPNQQENAEEFDSKYVQHVPIKKMKQEMMKELRSCDDSIMISSQLILNPSQLILNQSYFESSKLNQTSDMDTYLQEEAHMIGLKFFKEKMKTYDPLDILISMLHVAFEEQAILQPVYVPNQNSESESDIVLTDILIHTGRLN